MSIDATAILIQDDPVQEALFNGVFRAGPYGVRRLRDDQPALGQLEALADGLRGPILVVADLGRLAAEGLWWPQFAAAARARFPTAALLASDARSLLPRYAVRQWARRHGAIDVLGMLAMARLRGSMAPLQDALLASGLPAVVPERAEDMLRSLPPPAAPSAIAARHAAWRQLELRGVDPQGLARQMRTAGGVEVADRTYRFKTYPQCFRGDEATQWLSAQLGISRAQAVDVGELLRLHGAFAHVVHEHGFLDEGKFYRFSDRSPDVDVIDLDLVAHEARHGGFDARDRTWHGQAYPAVFLGSEAHQWLMRFYGLGDASARELGQRLLETHLFRHVVDEHPFAAKDLFYRFTADRPRAHPAPVPSAIPAFSRSAP